jgi:hypothetical protein
MAGGDIEISSNAYACSSCAVITASLGVSTTITPTYADRQQSQETQHRGKRTEVIMMVAMQVAVEHAAENRSQGACGK